MTNKIRVAVATYTNTLPFLRGIQSTTFRNRMELIMDYPSACADRVIRNEADLGIIPIRALLDIPNFRIISDYCIGADGAVDSVFIFAEVPIEEVHVLRLDVQSKTSNGLAQILLKNYWKRDVELVHEGPADAYVEIGDRTFGRKDTVPYAYDLAHYWKKMTGLPFAFAVWASNKKLPDAFESEFNAALASGVSDLESVIDELPIREDFNYRDYLTNKLDFRLTAQKREAIDKYLKLYKELECSLVR